ncbi:MAG TPA: hypothetical protein VGF55_10935 [Gemmataceae bacterium]
MKKKRWTLVGAALGAGATLALVLGLGVLAGSGSAAAKAAPRNTAPPTISGTLVEGQVLTAGAGTWTGTAPISYSYQWLRCDSAGNNCANIIGATGRSYRLTSADVNNTLRVDVTAKNREGSAEATSGHTGVVTARKPPVNTAPPTISGNPVEDQTLVAQPGTWTGTQPIAFTYQWLRCDRTVTSRCSTIVGATAQTYRLGSADIGTTVRIVVTAKNKDGQAPATSAATAVIGAAPPPTGCPPGPGPAAITAVTPPARLLVDHMQFAPSVITSGTRTIVARFHVSNTCGQAVQGALVYATAVPFNQLNVPAEQATGADGWAQIVFQVARGFPASKKQQRLTMFVRARKGGENVLAGISSRRLISTRVSLAR